MEATGRESCTATANDIQSDDHTCVQNRTNPLIIENYRHNTIFCNTEDKKEDVSNLDCDFYLMHTVEPATIMQGMKLGAL